MDQQPKDSEFTLKVRWRRHVSDPEDKLQCIGWVFSNDDPAIKLATAEISEEDLQLADAASMVDVRQELLSAVIERVTGRCEHELGIKPTKSDIQTFEDWIASGQV